MELKKLKILLEKYETGESSLAEEKALREYFKNNEVPENLKTHQLIFGFLAEEKEKHTSGEIQLRETSKSNKHLWTAIAASVILLIGLFLFQNDSQQLQDSELGTIQNKEEALQKSVETLKMVSELMNESKQDLIYLKEFNNTKNKFIKTE